MTRATSKADGGYRCDSGEGAGNSQKGAVVRGIESDVEHNGMMSELNI
jgi:hypothetical protein